MKVTARCLIAFAPMLEPADLLGPADRAAAAGPVPDHLLRSLIRFEGALAWESGAPRDAVPAMMVPWAAEVWLAGWDDADARFIHAGEADPGQE